MAINQISPQVFLSHNLYKIARIFWLFAFESYFLPFLCMRIQQIVRNCIKKWKNYAFYFITHI